MDLDLLGFLCYFQRKNASGIMNTEKGYSLSDRESKAYDRLGINNGYKTIKEMLEFEEVKDQLKIK